MKIGILQKTWNRTNSYSNLGKERLDLDDSEPKLLPYKKFVEAWIEGHITDVDDLGITMLVSQNFTSKTLQFPSLYTSTTFMRETFGGSLL